MPITEFQRASIFLFCINILAMIPTIMLVMLCPFWPLKLLGVAVGIILVVLAYINGKSALTGEL